MSRRGGQALLFCLLTAASNDMRLNAEDFVNHPSVERERSQPLVPSPKLYMAIGCETRDSDDLRCLRRRDMR